MIFVKQSVAKIPFISPAGHIETCGRVAYQSKPKGDPVAFCSDLLKSGHMSVFEHVFATLPGGTDSHTLSRLLPMSPAFFDHGLLVANLCCWSRLGNILPFISGADENLLRVYDTSKWATLRIVCDIGIAREIMRHRMAFTQESTRFCTYKGELQFIEDTVSCEHGDLIQLNYHRMIQNGIKAQEARDILPLGLKTELVATTTMKHWDYIIGLREKPDCHPKMIKLAGQIRKALYES